MNDSQHLQWKPIEGTLDLEVSNFGNVRSKGGFEYSTFVDKSTGYIKVNIVIDGIKKQIGVHVLVAKAFVPNPFDKEYVNHKNGDKTNNCQWNLEWNTAFENQMHRRYVLGKDMNGKNNPMYGMSGVKNPKFKDWVLAVNEDGTIRGRYATQTEAAKTLFNNVNVANQISRCLSHKRNCKICRGFYWMYEKEYTRMTQADLKPCELLEHPEIWLTTYRGQSAAKPQNNKY